MRLRLLESLTMFVVLGLVKLASPCVAQEGPFEAAQLAPGQTLERELTGAETHRYKFDLQTSEFFQVRVEQKGVDVALKLLDAKGKVLATTDSPNSKEGPETLSWVAASGSYLLELNGFDPQAGKYTIRREPSRPATSKDRRRVEVEQVVVAGMTARDMEGQGSIAVGKLEAALAGWQELRDEYLAQLTAQQIGSVYADLGEKQKGLEFNNQAVPILRAVGNRNMEATTTLMWTWTVSCAICRSPRCRTKLARIWSKPIAATFRQTKAFSGYPIGGAL